jgi:hypothetical protein
MFLRVTHVQFKFIFFEFGKRLSGTIHSPLTANFAIVPMDTPVYLNTKIPPGPMYTCFEFLFRMTECNRGLQRVKKQHLP